MTKMHRGKKAAASLMAGILLCQMFVYDVVKDICKKGLDSMSKENKLLFGLGVCDGEV